MAASDECVLNNGNSLSVTIYDRLSLWRRRCGRSHKCVSSKAVILILFWSFSVSLIHHFIFQRAQFLLNQLVFNIPLTYYPCLYAFKALIMCFYPLAGFLADTKYGRFKMITRISQWLLVFSFIMGMIIVIFILIGHFVSDDSTSLIIFICLSVIFFPSIIVIIASSVIFNANIIQFGVDQLQDSPADHQRLYIHWYVWAYYLGELCIQIGMSRTPADSSAYMTFLLQFSPIAACIILLLIVVLIVHYKKFWFIIDTARSNPYKLVYRVTKFARQHKVPIRRSAFTYCEDDIPSGLDLGKSKYGGPFTTEEVEDVKAFYGILKILLAFGIATFMNVASKLFLPHLFNLLSSLSVEYTTYRVTNGTGLLIKNSSLSSLVVVLFLPFYILLILPFSSSYKVRIFGRIGVGMMLLLMSVSSTFITDTIAHTRYISESCMISSNNSFTLEEKSFHPAVLLPQLFLHGLSVLVIYPALYEFICAQSPHSMKGLLIGLSFAIRGLFELLASILLLPFVLSRLSLPSCGGMVYYMITIVVGVVGLAVYVYVARKYKLRERDEQCPVRRFVEDYYSKIQEEENF